MAKYYFTTKKRKPLPNGERWTKENSIEIIADDYKEAADYVRQTFGIFDGGYSDHCTLSSVKVYSVDISSKKAIIELREKFEHLEAERDMLKRCLEIAETALSDESRYDESHSLNKIKAIKESFYPF